MPTWSTVFHKTLVVSPLVLLTAACGSGSAPTSPSQDRTLTAVVEKSRAPIVCTYAVSGPASLDVPASGASTHITVTAPSGCRWTATDNASWIHLSIGSGSGTNTLKVTIDANKTGAPRTGVVSIAQTTIAVTQTAIVVDPLPLATTQISFSGLKTNNAPVTTYTESGFTVATASASWVAWTTYGHPAPFITFFAAGGSSVTGEVRVTAGGAAFVFKSVDLYSSTTRIPYRITGSRRGAVVFTLSDTLPNTFGDFATVSNANAATSIDTLTIALTNAAAPCCRNPMGLDTIVVAK
ncbi:MAG TPA: BACON domain-containing protein [Vicinamibacterales bacterium]|nr:BACON domain-containing protein [Vicinamibacterales bacterium]